MAPRQVALSSNEPALPFQIRGTSFTLLALKVIDPRDGAFFDRLENTLALAPGFYRNAPIVLDLSSLNRAAPVDMATFCRKLRALTLLPVGIQGANAEWEEACLAAGLAVFPSGKAANPSAVRARSGSQAPRTSPSKLVTEPVRSGQRVYAAEADLIVTAPVSRGAELLADGNIHVYAPLRGRALAGMNGDPSTRIFCRHLDADLVSIGGFYMVSEQMDPGLIGKAVQISLVGDRLIFEPL